LSDNTSIRERFNELTLNGSDMNQEQMSDSMSLKSGFSKMKKRRFRELDRSCWSINDFEAHSDSLVATHISDEAGKSNIKG
jgi:hypothetical protein